MRIWLGPKREQSPAGADERRRPITRTAIIRRSANGWFRAETSRSSNDVPAGAAISRPQCSHGLLPSPFFP